MTIVKSKSGRFQAILKVGREYVGARTFNTRREAVDWYNREKAALDGGKELVQGSALVGHLRRPLLSRRAAPGPRTGT